MISATGMREANARRSILLVSNYPSDVGYAWWLMEEFWCAIAEAAHDRGRSVILAFPELGDVSGRIRTAPIDCVEMPVLSTGLSQQGALWDLVRNRQVTAVYFTDRPYRSLLYARLRWLGVRHILMHDHMPGDRTLPGPLKAGVKRILHALPFWTCDRYIGVSRFVRDRFVTRVCLPPEKCSYVLNGIEPAVLDAGTRQDVRRELSVNDDDVIVISCGRLSAYKRVDLIVAAAAMVHDLPGVRFFHVGDGPERSALEADIRRFGLESRFTLLGNRSDARRLMQGADIALHASKGEAFSLAILEFMSAGLATVVPDNSGNREAVTDCENGLVVADGSAEALADAVRLLVEDPVRRRALGEFAHQIVSEHFTLARARAEVAEIVAEYL